MACQRSGPIQLSFVIALSVLAVPLEAQARSPDARLGTYRFEERVGGEVVTQGTFTVTADSVTVEAVPGPCRYSPDSRPAGPIIYVCDKTKLSFDRLNPVDKARVSFDKRVVETERVCRVYTTGTGGQQVCSRYGFEQTEKFVPTTIRLRPTRVDAP